MSEPNSAAPASNAEPTEASSQEILSEEESGELPQEAVKQEVAKQVAALKKYKLKVDGREEEMEFDSNNEQELIKHLQLAKVAQKRMSEAAQMKKEQQTQQSQLQEFFNLLKSNPAAILSDPSIGIDVKEFAIQHLEQLAEESQKSPELREKEELQRKLEALEKERSNDRKERERAEYEKMESQAAAEIDREIDEAINKSEIPKSPYVVKKMAEYMMLALDEGINISAKEIVPIVKKAMITDMQSMIGVLPEDLIEEIVGRDRIASLRKKQIKKYKESPKTKVEDTGATITKSLNKKEEKVHMKDFFKKLGSF